MRGRASPHGRRGPTPFDTLGSSPPVAWSFSPARLNAVGAGPAAPRGRAEPACTTWSEKTPGGGHPEPAPGVAVLPGAELRHARSHIPGAVSCRTLGRRAPAVARTPLHKPFAMAPETLWHLLTNFFLRWCQAGFYRSFVRVPAGWRHAGLACEPSDPDRRRGRSATRRYRLGAGSATAPPPTRWPVTSASPGPPPTATADPAHARPGAGLICGVAEGVARRAAGGPPNGRARR
jgi:hypothetical protein